MGAIENPTYELGFSCTHCSLGKQKISKHLCRNMHRQWNSLRDLKTRFYRPRTTPFLATSHTNAFATTNHTDIHGSTGHNPQRYLQPRHIRKHCQT